MALAHLTALFETAKTRMLWQYKALVAYVADVGVLVAEAQELEDAFWDFFNELDLDQADGVWLERLGGLIGEKREGFDDEPAGVVAGYRYLIKARALANKSFGTSDDILGVVLMALAEELHLGSPALSLVDWYPAAQALTISNYALGGQVGDETLNRVVRLVQVSRAVAVDTQLFYQDDVDAEIFVCGDSGGGSPTGKGFDDEAAPDDPAAGRLAGVSQA